MSAPSFSDLLSASFILAVSAGLCTPQLVFPLTKDNQLTSTLFTLSALIIGPAWAILTFILLRNHGKAALWVLIGFPLALNCTAQLFLLLLACATGNGCL